MFAIDDHRDMFQPITPGDDPMKYAKRMRQALDRIERSVWEISREATKTYERDGMIRGELCTMSIDSCIDPSGLEGQVQKICHRFMYPDEGDFLPMLIIHKSDIELGRGDEVNPEAQVDYRRMESPSDACPYMVDVAQLSDTLDHMTVYRYAISATDCDRLLASVSRCTGSLGTTGKK